MGCICIPLHPTNDATALLYSCRCRVYYSHLVRDYCNVGQAELKIIYLIVFYLRIYYYGSPQNLKPPNSYFDGHNIILVIWTTFGDSVKLPVDNRNIL